MTSVDGKGLLRVLRTDYQSLLRQLTLRLGSRERADAALQETVQRLERDPGRQARSPTSYLLEMAAHIATSRPSTDDNVVDAGAQENPLVEVLLKHYDAFLHKLTHSFGSREIASEALQETYLRLQRGGIDAVQAPRSYLLTMAFNIAKNRIRAENRYVPSGLSEAFEDLLDETPDQSRTVEAQSEWRALRSALEDLPSQRREMFEAAYVYDTPVRAIARRYGVSERTVQREIARALEHVHNAWEDSLGQGRRDV